MVVAVASEAAETAVGAEAVADSEADAVDSAVGVADSVATIRRRKTEGGRTSDGLMGGRRKAG